MDHEAVKEGMMVDFKPLRLDERKAATGIVLTRPYRPGTRPVVWLTIVQGVGWADCKSLSPHEGGE